MKVNYFIVALFALLVSMNLCIKQESLRKPEEGHIAIDKIKESIQENKIPKQTRDFEKIINNNTEYIHIPEEMQSEESLLSTKPEYLKRNLRKPEKQFIPEINIISPKGNKELYLKRKLIS